MFGNMGVSLLQAPICYELKQIIRDIIGYVRIAQSAWVSLELDSHDEGWLFLRLQALNYRLFNLKELQSYEECISLTTLLFLPNATQHRGTQLGASLLQRLQ